MTAAALPVLREVRLYGPLRARFGRSHWLAVDSPAEAVHALCMLFEGFRQAVLGHKGPGYRVLVGESTKVDWRDADTLTLGAGSARVIRIAPVIHGAKRGGLGTIIAGVALLIVAPYLGSVVAGAFAGQAAALVVGSAVVAGAAALGKAMILGGVVQLLSPQRKGSASQADKTTSYAFSGPVNVTDVGAPVPLIIGRCFAGSVVASAGVSTDEYTPPAITLPTNPALPVGEPLDWRQLPGADLP